MHLAVSYAGTIRQCRDCKHFQAVAGYWMAGRCACPCNSDRTVRMYEKCACAHFLIVEGQQT